MSRLRERLEKCKRDREATQNWYEGRFSRSPWMTTLLSALMGPLLILLLLLTTGPCIITRLIAFIRKIVSAVQILMLCQHYQRLVQGSADYIESEI